jgi:hypothetical protein
MATSKLTLTVARMALGAARDSLPDHAKAKSPKKFRQPQLVVCLVIKEFRQLDYRGTQLVLEEWSDLRRGWAGTGGKPLQGEIAGILG